MKIEDKTKRARRKKLKRRVPTSSVDKPKDVEMQQAIRSRANYSLALLGMAFVRRGSGRFVNLRANSRVK